MTPGSAPSPMVGILWVVPNRDGTPVLLTAGTPLAAAEPYGDCLTHGRGHAETWEDWRRLGAGGLAARGLPTTPAVDEYDEHPRGRVVFHANTGEFSLYLDRRIQKAVWIERIRAAFNLADQPVTVWSDAHYR